MFLLPSVLLYTNTPVETNNWGNWIHFTPKEMGHIETARAPLFLFMSNDDIYHQPFRMLTWLLNKGAVIYSAARITRQIAPRYTIYTALGTFENLNTAPALFVHAVPGTFLQNGSQCGTTCGPNVTRLFLWRTPLTPFINSYLHHVL